MICQEIESIIVQYCFFHRGQPWTVVEEEELLRLYEKYAHIEDKNERYRKIAKPLHRGKTECWEKYKQLVPKNV